MVQKMEEEIQEKSLEIIGPETVQSYDVVKFFVPNGTLQWILPAAAPIKVLSQTQDELKIKILEVGSPTTFELGYGNQVMTINVKPFQ